METPGKKVDLQFVSNLYNEFTQELSNIKEDDTIRRLVKAVQITQSWLARLREYITQHQFENTGDQIAFFKKLKPNFCSHLLYYSQVYRIEIKKPVGSAEKQKQYIQLELEKISDDFENNREFYLYIRTGEESNDHSYFVLGQQAKPSIISFFPEYDPKYSTGYDYLVAAYWANEKLAQYLNRKLANLDKPPVDFRMPTEAPKLVWTDSKTALIELVYAFKAKGSFNNGKATLKDITDHVQQFFGVEITNPTRDFQEILRRKTGYTIYLDGLKDSYLKYIDAIENKERRR